MRIIRPILLLICVILLIYSFSRFLSKWHENFTETSIDSGPFKARAGDCWLLVPENDKVSKPLTYNFADYGDNLDGCNRIIISRGSDLQID